MLEYWPVEVLKELMTLRGCVHSVNNPTLVLSSIIIINWKGSYYRVYIYRERKSQMSL